VVARGRGRGGHVSIGPRRVLHERLALLRRFVPRTGSQP
jgi:hypothetical protein